MENLKGRKQLRLAAVKTFVESAKYAAGNGLAMSVGGGRTGVVPQ